MVRRSGFTYGQNHHYEQEQLSTKRYESHERKLRWVGSDARRHPNIHARETLALLVYTNRQFSSRICALDHDWMNQQPMSEYFVGVSRSIILEVSSFKTTPRKMIWKKHRNLVSKKEDLFIDSKKSSRSWKPTIHNIISNWSSARHQILEKEMSCNLFSDLSVTNIRIHIWTKSSLRARTTEYQMVWESWKKVEIGWFWREATPNYSCKGNCGMTCLH